MQGLVDYILESGPNAGETRSAIITRDWGGGALNLKIFTDQADGLGGELYTRTSVMQGTGPGQWQIAAPPGTPPDAQPDLTARVPTVTEEATIADKKLALVAGGSG